MNRYVQERDEAPAIGWEHYPVIGTLAGSFLASRAGSRAPAHSSASSPAASFLWVALLSNNCVAGAWSHRTSNP